MSHDPLSHLRVLERRRGARAALIACLEVIEAMRKEEPETARGVALQRAGGVLRGLDLDKIVDGIED